MELSEVLVGRKILKVERNDEQLILFLDNNAEIKIAIATDSLDELVLRVYAKIEQEITD